jgi:hypothetical protein
LPEISQRRLGDAMRALGHHKKPRLADGRIHYQGLAWKEPDTEGLWGRPVMPAQDGKWPAWRPCHSKVEKNRKGRERADAIAKVAKSSSQAAAVVLQPALQVPI